MHGPISKAVSFAVCAFIATSLLMLSGGCSDRPEQPEAPADQSGQTATFLGRSDHVTLFVAVRKEENRRFIDLILSFASKSGLRSNMGYATDDQGKTVTVIEAIGGNARLLVSNVTLSGEEPAPCERHFEGYPDPEQFEVRVGTQSGSVQRERQAELLAGVENMLE